MSRYAQYVFSFLAVFVFFCVWVNAESAPAPAPAPAGKPADAPAPAPAPAEKPADAPAPAPAEKPADAPAAPAPAPAKTWKTVELKSQPLKVDSEAAAIVWADEIAVLKLEPKNWAKFEVASVVAHGQTVKKGDVLIQFKKEDYDQALQDQALETQLAKIAHQKALLQQQVTKVTFAITMKTVNRKKADRIIKWEHNKKYDLSLNKRTLDLSMAASNQSYENQKAELEQLSRMYETNELNEQSEEIVLKRQRLALKSSALDLERAKARYEWAKKMLVPRMEEELQDEFDSEMAQIEAEVANLELTRQTMEIECRKEAIQYQKLGKKFNEFREDAQWFELKAPCDGIVLYGSLEDGTWANYAKCKALLVPGNEVPAKAAFLSVVNPQNIFLKLTISEANFAKIAPRQKGWFVPASYPDAEIPAEVTGLDAVISGTEYAGKASLKPEPGMNLVPGLKGKMMIASVRKTNAILVPAAAVGRNDDLSRYVYVLDEAKNEPVRRSVKVGIHQENRLEILDGLAAGMKILEDVSSAESNE